jgi:hypothetical protein
MWKGNANDKPVYMYVSSLVSFFLTQGRSIVYTCMLISPSPRHCYQWDGDKQ